MLASAAPIPNPEITFVDSLEQLPDWADLEALTTFFHETMKPYHDQLGDVERGLRFALDPERPGGGFAGLARLAGALVGGVVFLRTGMRGYVPENMLLFAAVDPELRGRGLGRALIERALARCKGAVKLHVEYDNPARRLYERIGFESKYAEMRYQPPDRGSET
jgi:GNAT superfamily N-acetyltransferase